MLKVISPYLLAVSSTVSLNQLKVELQLLEAEAEKEIEVAIDANSLEKLRVGLLGKKGRLSAVLGAMGKLQASDRPLIGQRANVLKSQLQQLIFQHIRTLTH